MSAGGSSLGSGEVVVLVVVAEESDLVPLLDGKSVVWRKDERGVEVGEEVVVATGGSAEAAVAGTGCDDNGSG